MSASRRLDVICVGRAAVDLYGEQIGGRLEDMLSFAKYLGGSPANTAIGAARLGLRPAMLTRVGDEHNGRFVRETLAAEGVDVSHVVTDPRRLTALAILGIRDRDTFPLLFYREQCADMAIAREDFDAQFLASATAVCISGTHLSQPQTRDVSLTAMRQARAAGTRVVLDIDYRPVLWGLTGPGLGEQRYVRSDEISAHLQTVVPECDLIVGTEEEIRIAGGSPDTLAALRRLRELTPAMLVVKRGPMGCVVFTGPIPADIEQGHKGPGFPVDVFNILGAGDAFMAGFLRGYLRDEPLERCCAYANACGALVVSRHGCAPAMPSWVELQHFLDRGSPTRRLREDAGLERLHRHTTRARHWDELAVLAFDHRTQFVDLAAPHGAGEERIVACKRLIAEGARQGARDLPGAGIILDGRFGEDVLPRLTGHGWWIARPVEAPGSRPLAFEAGAGLALELRTWPREHVAKCLVFFDADDPAALRALQIERLRELQAACVATQHEFMIEVLPPRGTGSDAASVARAMDAIYGADVVPDWWKLPPNAAPAAWEAVTAVVARHDPHCRGVLLLGLEASEDDLLRGFAAAAAYPLVKGFAVGRSIWADAAAAWFAGRASDDDVVADVARRYARLTELWRQARAGAVAAEAQATARSLHRNPASSDAPGGDIMSESDSKLTKQQPDPQRRRILRASALTIATAGAYGAAPFFGPWRAHHAWAQSAQKKPLVIGLTMDASGQYAASGMEERLGAMMAIKEVNAKGGVLGRMVEAVHMDSETTPATGSRVAERLITRNEAAFLIGAIHSGVANAISQVAQKYGCIYLNTNSSSPTESGKDCHRVKFVWDGNGTNFALAIVKNAMAVNGKRWVMLTNDYVWGHSTAKAMRTIVEANGGSIVEEMLVPQNTRDFSSFLLKIQQIKPSVVATAVGGDDIKALRQQVVQLKMNKSPAWINNQQDWPDVYGLGPDAIFGVFGTNWYYRLDLPGVKEFVSAYQATYPGVQIRVPGNTYYNGYMGTRELLRAVERAGTTNNIRVIKELEGLKVPARERMQDFDAYMNPATHQMQQTLYMATYNDAPAEKDDIFRILAKLPPKEVEDPDAPNACKLESYEATPGYEM